MNLGTSLPIKRQDELHVDWLQRPENSIPPALKLAVQYVKTMYLDLQYTRRNVNLIRAIVKRSTDVVKQLLDSLTPQMAPHIQSKERHGVDTINLIGSDSDDDLPSTFYDDLDLLSDIEQILAEAVQVVREESQYTLPDPQNIRTWSENLLCLHDIFGRLQSSDFEPQDVTWNLDLPVAVAKDIAVWATDLSIRRSSPITNAADTLVDSDEAPLEEIQIRSLTLCGDVAEALRIQLNEVSPSVRAGRVIQILELEKNIQALRMHMVAVNARLDSTARVMSDAIGGSGAHRLTSSIRTPLNYDSDDSDISGLSARVDLESATLEQLRRLEQELLSFKAKAQTHTAAHSMLREQPPEEEDDPKEERPRRFITGIQSLHPETTRTAPDDRSVTPPSSPDHLQKHLELPLVKPSTTTALPAQPTHRYTSFKPRVRTSFDTFTPTPAPILEPNLSPPDSKGAQRIISTRMGDAPFSVMSPKKGRHPNIRAIPLPAFLTLAAPKSPTSELRDLLIKYSEASDQGRGSSTTSTKGDGAHSSLALVNEPTLGLPFAPAIKHAIRTSSTETGPSVRAPPSPSGAASPADEKALPPKYKKAPAGRVWDSRRDVSVFKEQSQDALARFLSMNTWEEGKQPQQQDSPVIWDANPQKDEDLSERSRTHPDSTTQRDLTPS